MTQETGSCMCGACRVTASLRDEAHICHCGLCRKWTAGAFISVECDGKPSFNDDAPLSVFRSSDWGERVSCRECGSSLLWRMQDGSMNVISVQLFDDPGRFPVTSEIFIDRKPASYSFAGEHKTMTESEVMAMFAAKEEG
ncbi:GFA family protein [Paracoccus aerodenitrificans]|uniref:GFA family protein n=1 Tax=Paracoccus aerodenitrificans TaxID=3017781 RepID=UPI0022F10EF2|nr:GFA family protein [Paracoccus aerodenitrificans]WBU63194.1 GFA family protein [Paracoccus aerodenitrificans]